MTVKLSLVVPMYNEADNIEAFFKALIPVVERTVDEYEVICVNDGSSDNTIELLKTKNQTNQNIKVIDLSRNFGKEFALTAGLQFTSGDAVIPLDADLQDPPELIPELIEKWREGYKVIHCVRTDRQSDSFIKRSTANLFYRINRKLSDVPIPENVGDFRLMDRQVVEALRQLPERTRFMKGLFAWLGYDQTQVTYIRSARSIGTTKWSFWRLWNFALDGIFSFSTAPLRIWTYLGFLVAVAAAIYMAFIIFRVLIMGVDVPGYASTVVLLLFFSGLNMIGLGILGEYIGRIFTEVKQRPLYLIKQTIGLENSTPPVNQNKHRPEFE
ncbi:glycosyltransferase family 2 protein [Thermodesulfobacteriota bacterium]